MSVTQVPLRPVAKGTLVKLWLAIAALVALAYRHRLFRRRPVQDCHGRNGRAGSGPVRSARWTG